MEVALEQHDNLENFSLLNIPLGRRRHHHENKTLTVNETASYPWIVMDPILDALASIPTLRYVHISPCFRVNKGRSLSANPDCINSLLQRCTRLESLSLRNVGLHDVFGTVLAISMRSTKILRCVDLRFNNFGDETYQAWQETLEKLLNNTTMFSLSLDKMVPSLDLYLRLDRASRWVLVRQGGTLESCWEGFSFAQGESAIVFTMITTIGISHCTTFSNRNNVKPNSFAYSCRTKSVC